MEFWHALFFAAPVLGHVLYGIPSGRRVRLHNGDDFTDRDQPPTRVASVRGVSAEGTVDLTMKDGEVDTSALASSPGYIVVETPPTLIELAGPKFEGYLEHEGLFAVLQERANDREALGREIYSKHIKVALGPLSALAVPAGLPIEMLPLSDLPNLRVRVIANGAPHADAQVRVSYREANSSEPVADVLLRTDANGEFAVTIDKPGLWRLHTISMMRITGEADWKSIWTSLTFRLG